MNHKMIIFDVDGTLIDRDTEDILPGVAEWFEAGNGRAYQYRAVASNQGGVGLRYWMEKDGFGNPNQYPTSRDAYEHILTAVDKVQECDPGLRIDYLMMAYSYQSKKGHWSPIPPQEVKPNNQEVMDFYHKWHNPYGKWGEQYRKPNAGMLTEIMHGFGVSPSETLFVGDSIEDEQAAAAAGCQFIHADQLFGRVDEDES